MPSTPRKTPASLANKREGSDLPGETSASELELQEAQVGFVLTSMTSKEIAAKLFPLIKEDSGKLKQAIQANKGTEDQRHEALSAQVLLWAREEFSRGVIPLSSTKSVSWKLHSAPNACITSPTHLGWNGDEQSDTAQEGGGGAPH
jgi:hypothetical protein